MSLPPCPDRAASPISSSERAKTDTDAILVLRVKQGDMTAFEELVEKYKQPIINFASRTLGDPTEAQDVAQNVFLHAFRASRGFRFAGKVST